MLLGAVDLSTFCNKADSDDAYDESETTTFQAPGGARTFIPGNEEGKVMLGGYVDTTLDTGSDALLRAALGGADRPLSIGWSGWAVPGAAAATTNRIWMVPAGWVKSYKPGSTIGSALSWSAECRGDGPLVGGYAAQDVLQRETGTRAAANARAIDLSAAVAAASVSWIAALHVITLTETSPNVTIKVKDSATGANGSFADIASAACTFTAATGAGSQQTSGTSAVRRYICVDITLNSGSITDLYFAVAFAVLGAGGAGL